MVVALVALLAGGMDRHIGRDPVTVSQLLGEVHGQPSPLSGVQLVRQGDEEFPRYLGVRTFVLRLDCVPQLDAGWTPCRTGRHHDVGRLDAALARVIVHLAGTLVGDLDASAIRGGSG